MPRAAVSPLVFAERSRFSPRSGAMSARWARGCRPGRTSRSPRRRPRSRSTPVSTALRLDALVLVGLGEHAERVGADAEVRVHRDEHGGAARRPRRGPRTPSGGWRCPSPPCRWRSAARAACSGRRPVRKPPDLSRHALRERAARLAQIVEEANDVARVAAALRALALELVDLLDDVDRDDDVVVVEPEDRVRDRGGGCSCRGRSSSSSAWAEFADVPSQRPVLQGKRGTGRPPRVSSGGEVASDALAHARAHEPAARHPEARDAVPIDLPPWLVRAERLLIEAVRSVRLLGSVVPRNAPQERARLVAALEAGQTVNPAVVLRAHRPHAAPQGARARRGSGSAPRAHPVAQLYAARAASSRSRRPSPARPARPCSARSPARASARSARRPPARRPSSRGSGSPRATRRSPTPTERRRGAHPERRHRSPARSSRACARRSAGSACPSPSSSSLRSPRSRRPASATSSSRPAA